MSGSPFAAQHPNFDWKWVDSMVEKQANNPALLLAANDGVSAQTKGALMRDAGYDARDFAPDEPAGALSSQPPSKSKGFVEPTMTQQDRDAQIRRDKAEADAARQRWIERGRK